MQINKQICIQISRPWLSIEFSLPIYKSMSIITEILLLKFQQASAWQSLYDMHDDMMAWKVFSIIGHLWGIPSATTGFPSQKAIDAERWYFLWCQPKQTIQQPFDKQLNLYVFLS